MIAPTKATPARVHPRDPVSDADLAELLAIEERWGREGLTFDELTAYNARLAGCARGLLLEVGEAREKARADMVKPDPLPPGGTYDATFHRVQDGYPDGWPRAVFVDSDGEPVGVRCGPHEAAAIEAGAKALIEVAALRAGVAKFVEGAKVNATDGRRCLLSTNHADHDALAGLVKS